jgi:dethiobiotin synthetase
VKGLFITGTDTEVGKTHFVCEHAKLLIQQGFRVGVYKPLASGYPREDHRSDAARLHRALGEQGANIRLEQINPQCFLAPLAPPLAARVEGAGGLLSPITWTMTNADLASKLGYPIVVVAENRLGCVHQILSTVQVAKGMNLAVDAVVLNQVRPRVDTSEDQNRELLEAFLRRIDSKIAIWEQSYAPSAA